MRWMLMLFCALSAPCFGFMAPSVSVSVAVVDEFSNPIEGAEVIGTFLGVTDFDEEHVLTDSDGKALVTGRSYFPIGIAVRKSRFYGSAVTVNTKESVDKKEHFRDRKVTVVLKEKRNPIPLYAKRYSGEIPVAEEWIGFDLEAGDWVVPYGKGVSADLRFRYEGYTKSFLDARGELHLGFSNFADGLVDISESVDVASELVIPHQAPQEGYSKEEQWWNLSMSGSIDAKHKPSNKKHYFFRIRSVMDDKGEVIEANYAKLYRDVRFFFKTKKGGVAGIAFDYYFNPTPNDRNLEFNINRNLFGNLPHEEQVREP